MRVIFRCMVLVSKNKNQYTLRFGYKENFLEKFREFLASKKIRSGWFWGLGAVIDPELSYYDLKKEKYLNKKFKGKFEVVSLIGNMAYLNKELILHPHIVLSGRNYKAIGGHLSGGRVAGTLELFLDTGQNFKRKLDHVTGLNLLA